MTDELLPYYRRELTFLNKMGQEFAEAHPKIAGRLRLGPNLSDDPHVARLLEAFAYLNARVRHKLEDDFPEITEAMLGVLYPHYLAPVPSMAIVELTLDRSQAELSGGYVVPRGEVIESEPTLSEGDPCRFRTCYDAKLWPIELAAANFKGHPFPVPAHPATAKAVAALRLELQTFSSKVAFRQMPLDRLRFYLHGQSQNVYDLYELLLNNAVGILLATGPDDPRPVFLPSKCLRPVGFERDEGVLPYGPQSFIGYRLLSEYFAFPEKFLFIDLTGIKPRHLSGMNDRLEVFVLVNRNMPDLEKNVSRDTFRLGCTPVINLFQRRAEPIRVGHEEFEYRVIPDARRPRSHEVYSIDRVTGTSSDGEQVDFEPFYSAKHVLQAKKQQTFWYAKRREAGYAGGRIDNGTEVYLSFVDLGFSPAAPRDWTIDVEVTCLNRDLPRSLPFGGGQPKLQFAEGGGLARIQCLTRPTPTLRPALLKGTYWRLISHLSLNHLSLANNENGAEALREILKLYDFRDSEETRAIVASVLSVQSRRVVGRVGGDVAAGFCRGVEITVDLAEERFAGSGIFLFASVLERFLGLYSSINSFTTLVARSNKREKAIHRWPPRAGEQVLL